MKNQGGRRREFSMSRILSIFARTSVCGLLLLFIVTTASAQFKAGIQGTVNDTAGGLVTEAKITLVNTETGKAQETTASSEGFYRISRLAPAKDNLTVAQARYKHEQLDKGTGN